jgi:RNA polymerase sigma factor (sigma-70 family)
MAIPRKSTQNPAVSIDEIAKVYEYTTWILRKRGCVDGEEIADEAVLDAFKTLEKDRSSSGYFKKMVVQRAGKHAKRVSNRQLCLPLYQPIEALYDRLSVAGPSAEVECMEQAGQEILLAAISRLTRDERFVIFNFYVYGLTQEQAAIVLNCSVRTVRRRFSKAKEHLSGDAALREFFLDE